VDVGDEAIIDGQQELIVEERQIEASLCQAAVWGASRQRRGRGRSVVVGSGE
jgi:hypothetical protein